ncbi:MAG: hypothetical protein JWM89_3438 [Acidimicrobiales bacterium]|nr:hypothetical protein [Acidimicrobiales bacterium]
MVDPVSVGFVVSALIAEAETKAITGTVDAGVEVVRRGVERIKSWFVRNNDGEGTAALTGLVMGPDSGLLRSALGARLDGLAQDPEVRAFLDELVRDAGAAGVDVAVATQVAVGDYNNQIQDSPGASITVNDRAPRPPTG